ncbi:MAG: ParA family protein, partial [Planctomycetales bacterium]|nr:ParA family protein [Planctomycetales bacterium]
MRTRLRIDDSGGSTAPMNNHRMRKLAFLNQKGGVGKTTSAVNLAAALAAGGHRVCLVDLDPQAHASLHLNVVLGPDDPSIYDVLTGEMTLAGARHEVTLGPLRDGCDDIQHHNGRLCVVGAHINLAAAEVELVSVVGREMILADRIAEDVAQADEEHTWDYLILDCPPSLGLLTLNALVAVDEVYIPMQPHFLALHGLGKLLETIQLVRKRLNPQLRLGGVILSMYDAGTRL